MDFRVHEWSHKKWKYFPNALNNNNIPFIEQDYKNICAIINKFRPSIAVINGEEQAAAYNKMMIIAKKDNIFAKKPWHLNSLFLKKIRPVKY